MLGSLEWWDEHTVVRRVVTHLNAHGARVLFTMPGRELTLVAETPEQAARQLAYARERWPEGIYEVHEVRFWREVNGSPGDPVHTLIAETEKPPAFVGQILRTPAKIHDPNPEGLSRGDQRSLEDTVAVARDFLADPSRLPAEARGLAGTFAAALVQIAGACVVGQACELHGGAVHGKEAEELRGGVERILRSMSDVPASDEFHALREARKALILLLDRIDARDSLAFLEATDPKEDVACL